MDVVANPEHHTELIARSKLIGARGTDGSTHSHDSIHVDPTLAVPLEVAMPKDGMARVRRTSMNRRLSAEPYPAPRLALTSGAVEGARTASHENDTNMKVPQSDPTPHVQVSSMIGATGRLPSSSSGALPIADGRDAQMFDIASQRSSRSRTSRTNQEKALQRERELALRKQIVLAKANAARVDADAQALAAKSRRCQIAEKRSRCRNP